MVTMNYAKAAGMPSGIRAEYLTDPRMALAQELMKSAESQQVQSPLGGMAKMGSMLAQAYGMRNLQDEYAGRGSEYRDTLAKALSQGAGTAAQADLPGPAMNGSAGYSIPARAPDMGGMMQTLASNPDTADLASQLQLTQVTKQMDPEYALKQALYGSMLKDMGGTVPAGGNAALADAVAGPQPTPAAPAPAPQAGGTQYSPETLKLMTLANPAMANAVVGQQELAIKQKEASPGYQGDKAEAEATAKSMVARADETLKAGDVAQQQLYNINLAREIPLDGGALAPAKAKADALFKAFGVDTKGLGLEDATSAQTFTGLMQNLVLQKQIEQKGPQTEADAKRMEATLAQLGNTPEARQFLLDVGAAQLERNVDKKRFFLDWQEKHSSYKGAEKAWQEGRGGEPLPIAWDKYQPATAGAPAAPQVGMEQDGWRFKGGDPADPKSWEQIR